MPRRYRADPAQTFAPWDVPVGDFPSGSGPPLFLSVGRGAWHRLGPGQSRMLEMTGPRGGAFCYGLTDTLALVWIHLPPRGPNRLFCYHCPPGPLLPPRLLAALRAMGVTRRGSPDLYTVLASRREVTETEERSFLNLGVRPDRLFLYSGSVLPQFGVSTLGQVGEAA